MSKLQAMFATETRHPNEQQVKRLSIPEAIQNFLIEYKRCQTFVHGNFSTP